MRLEFGNRFQIGTLFIYYNFFIIGFLYGNLLEGFAVLGFLRLGVS